MSRRDRWAAGSVEDWQQVVDLNWAARLRAGQSDERQAQLIRSVLKDKRDPVPANLRAAYRLALKERGL